MLNIIKSEKIEELDKKKPITFIDELCLDEEPNILNICFHLHHGIRYYNQLERLENIFKEGKILANKHLSSEFIKDYYDNCNDNEYISLLEVDAEMEYNVFIRPNISLIISPFVDAIKTIYVPFELWEYIKENNIPVKNRFSYANGEYHVKDSIPLNMVKAIGYPYLRKSLEKGFDYADNYLNTIISLMKKYNINIPIIDTSDDYPNIIYTPNQEKKKTLIP